MTAANSSAFGGGGSTQSAPRDSQSLSALFSQLLDDASALVRNEIRLAKTELIESAGNLKVGAGAIAVAGAVLLAALLTWVATAVLALSMVVSPWLAALIVAVALTLVGVVLLSAAKRKFSDPAIKLDQTAESLQRDAEVIARRT